MAEELAIELKGISKSFGSIKANQNINLNLRKGEILALLGENGSGKTTLMNMLSGIYTPDSGSVFIDGEKVTISSPEDSVRLGIGMVHQHFKLVEAFSCADNIWIGARDKGLLLKKDRYKTIEDMAAKFGFEIDPKKQVAMMSVSEKQTLEILKVLYYGAKIIILDEPTAVLTIQETRKLFDVLRKMKESGHSIIIITHKLNEVMEISDRVAVLRKGEYIDTVVTAETNEKKLTELMVGRKVDLNINHPAPHKTQPLLEVRGLTVRNDDGAIAVDDLRMYIRGGEILGVAGIAGSGQKELCEAITGLRKIEHGTIIHQGKNIVGMSAREIYDMGIALSFIPEDRLGMGLAPSMSITDNVILKKYRKGKGPFVDRASAREEANAIVKKYEVATPSIDTPVRNLSGGNVQKVLLGREINAEPNVLITAYPVRGLDINSSYMIYDTLNEQKEKNVGVVFVGEDLDVMIALCDKIMVMCHGRVMGVVRTEKTDKEQLGLMMTGALDLTNAKIEKPAGIAVDSILTYEEWEKEIEASDAAIAAAEAKEGINE
ncbi:MAG: ABC transporter ATP-binding protein [Clostridiales bacterium]|nr:ABC transporter ATP-binding protein [Clostridiales bacterium]